MEDDEKRRVADLRAKTSELRDTAAARRGTELKTTAAQRGAEIRKAMGQMDVPWARCLPARMARETILQCGLAPLMGLYTRLHVTGHEHFDVTPPPVIL